MTDAPGAVELNRPTLVPRYGPGARQPAHQARRSVQLRFLVGASPLAVIAFVYLIALALVAIFADRIAPYDPLVGNFAEIRQAPSVLHLMGTDDGGRDVLSRVIFGARISLSVGFVSVAVGDLLGLIWGLTSGYIGGRFDLISQRLLEVLLSFPDLILGTMFMIVLGAGINTLIVAIAVTRVPAATRIIRSTTLSVKERSYVDSARALGASPMRIIFQHIAPQCVAPLLIIVSAHLGIAITTEAALSFLGVGVPPPAPSWGVMLAGVSSRFNPLWWLGVFPGLAIASAVLAANLAGDALRDMLDPQLRGSGR
jgi:ABC-type dipeptide/oligopeptide/nickel transport system permease subunit